MKVVIDTNTMIGHALWEDSVPNQAVEKAFRKGSVLRSRNSYFALEQMILSERFDKYLNRDARQKFLNLFKEISFHVEITERHTFVEDPSKNILLELAQNGKANFLISSQKELLSLQDSLTETRLITPSDFLQIMEEDSFASPSPTTGEED